jgi:hypothetical protein
MFSERQRWHLLEVLYSLTSLTFIPCSSAFLHKPPNCIFEAPEVVYYSVHLTVAVISPYFTQSSKNYF